MKKLISWQDADKLDIKTVWNYYKKFVNPGQVDLISSLFKI